MSRNSHIHSRNAHGAGRDPLLSSSPQEGKGREEEGKGTHGETSHHDRHLVDAAFAVGMMTIERFFRAPRSERVVRPELGHCIEWDGYRSPHNYGVIRGVQTHRLALLVAGVEIPDGHHVCHHCDNPPCIRVEHLFVGTRSENMRDMVAKGRHVYPKGDAHHRSKLTDEQVREIRTLYTGEWGDVARLGRLFGVSANQVSWILQGKRRVDAGGPLHPPARRPL